MKLSPSMRGVGGWKLRSQNQEIKTDADRWVEHSKFEISTLKERAGGIPHSSFLIPNS